MSIKIVLSLLALSGLAGIVLGYVLRLLIALGQRGSLELEVKQKMLEAKERANRVLEDAEDRAKKLEGDLMFPLKEREEKLAKAADRINKREEFLDERERALTNDAEDVKNRENEVANLKRDAEKLRDERRQELARVSHLSEKDAKAMLLKDLEDSHEESVLARLQKLEAHGREQLEAKGRAILLSVIHRMSSAVNSEVMTLSVTIPSEEVKGKIIGKEGRNIRTFERATGVDVIIDDTPGTLTLSCYDPIRRQIARIALENLILDGRIQPAKIEEAVQKAEQEITNIIKKKGAEAAYEAKVIGKAHV